MQITDHIYLIGSGVLGSRLSHDYDCNVYFIDAGDQGILVDCGAGMDMEALLANLKADGFQESAINWIIVTHSHADHSGGTYMLQQRSGAQVVSSGSTANIIRIGETAMNMKELREQGIYPSNYRYLSCISDIEISDGDRLQCGGLELVFIETPGHSHDQISLYIPQLGALFCSDLVFSEGRIAVQQSPDFSLVELERSTRKLRNYKIQHLLPGHYSPLLHDEGRTLAAVEEKFAQGIIPDSIV